MTNKAIEKDGVKYYKCRKCGKIKPLNKLYFHVSTTSMLGFNSKCIDCVREEAKTIYKPKERYITRAELLEENKKLKEKQKVLDKENCELIDENVRLKAKIDFYEKIYSSNYNGNTTLNGKYKLSEQHPNVGDM